MSDKEILDKYVDADKSYMTDEEKKTSNGKFYINIKMHSAWETK